MEETKLNPRVAKTLFNALVSGVVPRVGLNHIAVGRKKEVDAFLNDMEAVENGGAAFRFICGPYGSGKSFLIQMIRNNALEKGFVVLDADLSPDRYITGGGEKGLATYRELMMNMSVKNCTSGAVMSVVEKWIAQTQLEAQEETGLNSNDPKFSQEVSKRIQNKLFRLTELSYGFSFTKVIDAYWRGYCANNPELKKNALRWLRAEYKTKTDAKQDLGVDRIIEDGNWYEFLKLFAKFTTFAGFKGLLVFLDEGVNIYKINNAKTRNTNYEKILTIYNDTHQGKAAHIGFFLSGTEEFFTNKTRGINNYEAFKTRLAENPFVDGKYLDRSSPVINLQQLTQEEVYVLLERLAALHGKVHGYSCQLTEDEYTAFIGHIYGKLGAQTRISPREVTKSFLGLLNVLHDNPDVPFSDLIEPQETTAPSQKEDDPFFGFDI